MKDIILCFLFMSVIQCNMISIYDSSIPKSPAHHIDARKLLELCFLNEMNPVVISAELMNLMYEIQKNEIINSSILVIDNDFSSNVMKQYYTRHPSYLITADSMDRLQDTLRKMKSSTIWNPASVIVAVGKDCVRASEILQAIWKIEALKSYYDCQCGSMSESLVYTFNPFTQRAPKQWEQVETEDQPNDKWTLYRQHLKNDQRTCSSLTFDKTRSLDGYPLNGYKFGLTDKVFEGKVSPEAFFEEEATQHFIYNGLFTALNVTPIIYLKNVNHADFVREFNLLKNGTYDMKLEIIEDLDDEGFKLLGIIPIYTQGSFMIVTKKQSTISAFTKVTSNSFAYETLSLSTLFLFFIFVIILLNSWYHFAAALIDLWLLILGMEILTPMNRLLTRVTFLSATLFVFVVGPELQSQFTSVMTIPSVEKNIDTLDELHNNRYNVHYFDYLTENLKHVKIWENGTRNKYLHVIPDFESCSKNLHKDSAACILPDYLLKNIKIDDLHISKESLFKSDHRLTTRKNFPLKDKIDKTALNFVEAGFLNYFERKNRLKRQLKTQKRIDRIEAHEQCEFLDLTDFSSFLWCFTIVVLVALFVLLVELVCRVRKNRGSACKN
ncbi:uncharacterized protein LOC123267076 [Cotesia glomerata]|uniref:Ionotropic receptor n=1 Tax=Cotesia glomerata TaxID=32391 RepID=A0AAV7HGD4_COTGL|nr:uncharacterized protein LOC123267076 [Cotesia glomerata]KAH0535843.1 hypothetical protein KQX54_019664 [Cotesia glomerata]